MKKFLFLTGIFFSLSRLIAQGFSGSIEFKYATQKDTTTNMYWVKDKVVKLDQYSKKGNTIEGSFIFDLATAHIKFVNPKRKLWGEQKSETPQVIHGQCVVTQGSGSKTIAGIKCIEYTVKNTEENTVITYWIGDGKFTFFAPLIKLWNRKDKQSIYFGQIKNLSEGSMPLMSEEKQMSDGKSLTRLEVVKVNKSIPDESSMAVPPNYTKFDQ
jgi:hypothetical protein